MKTMTYWKEAFAADRSATREELHAYQIDRDMVKEYIDSLCDPDSLGVHDYIEEMKADIARYIADEAEIESGEDRDDLIETGAIRFAA